MSSVVGSIFGMMGANKQAKAAEKAADAQVEAARISADTQREMFDTSVHLGRPWRTSGQNALGALNYELGLGPHPEFEVAPQVIGANDPNALGTTPDRQGGSGGPAPQNALAGGGGFAGGAAGGRGQPVRDPRDSARQFTGYTGPLTGGRGANDPLSVPGWKREGYHASSPLTQTFARQNAPQQAPQQAAPPSQPQSNFRYKGFQETPGFKHNLEQGQQAIDRSAAARGGHLSGAAVKSGMRFGQGLANQEYSNHLARLAALSGVGGGFAASAGQNAITTGQGIANTTMAGAAGQGNALMQAGNARASGYSALGRGIGEGINALAGFAGYKQAGGQFGGIY